MAERREQQQERPLIPVIDIGGLTFLQEEAKEDVDSSMRDASSADSAKRDDGGAHGEAQLPQPSNGFKDSDLSPANLPFAAKEAKAGRPKEAKADLHYHQSFQKGQERTTTSSSLGKWNPPARGVEAKVSKEDLQPRELRSSVASLAGTEEPSASNSVKPNTQAKKQNDTAKQGTKSGPKALTKRAPPASMPIRVHRKALQAIAVQASVNTNRLLLNKMPNTVVSREDEVKMKEFITKLNGNVLSIYRLTPSALCCVQLVPCPTECPM